MNTVILDTLARALDALPLTREQRAKVYAAWEAAPDEPVGIEDGEYDAYLRSPAARAWHSIREMRLNNPEGSYYATTLEEASGYESAPTKTDLLAALARAERMIAA